MIYKNIKTGAVISSPCVINGKDWIREDEIKEKEPEVADEENAEIEESEPIPDEPEKKAETLDLESFTIADLKDFSEENGLKLDASAKKADMIKQIKAQL